MHRKLLSPLVKTGARRALVMVAVTILLMAYLSAAPDVRSSSIRQVNRGDDVDAISSSSKKKTTTTTTSTTSSSKETNFADNLARTKRLCGRLCDYREALARHDQQWDLAPKIAHWYRNFSLNKQQLPKLNTMVRKDVPVDCNALYSPEAVELWDEPARKMTVKIPPELWEDYTLGDRIRVKPWIIDSVSESSYLGGKAMVNRWPKGDLENIRSQGRLPSYPGKYGTRDNRALKSLLDIFEKTHLAGKRVLVVGSEHPWAEGILLGYDVAHITTLEYGEISTDHPQLTTYVPKDFAAAFRRGEIKPFDAVVSHSSLEHSGLGRYGDKLNPYGDVISIARVACVLKQGGVFFISFPNDSNDVLDFNAHRTYSHIRLSLAFTNWDVLYQVSGNNNDIFVLGKRDP